MRKKAILNSIKSNAVFGFMKKYSVAVIVILLIFILILLFILIRIEEANEWNWTAIGVVTALFGLVATLISGIVQTFISNKKISDDIQIRRAEFTNQFIKDFQKLMPELAFCAYLYENFNDGKKADPKVKELQRKLLKRNQFDFSSSKYNNLKRELCIDDKVIGKAKEKFQKSKIDDIIKIAEQHYTENGLNGFCSFHVMRNEYEEHKERIMRSVESEDRKKELDHLDKLYVSSIFVSVKNVVNELECNTLSVQFDLLDYDKITNLIYVPLHHYISNLYIIMMENKMEHEKRNYFIYSNIKRFCGEIIKIKTRIDTEMDLECTESEARREEFISNATNVKKL